MEALSDLNTFAKILTEKGYNGYFHTQGAYAGKLKDSISEYLENCQKGADSLPKQDLLLTGYLQWSGENKPRVECNMWVKYLNGKFSLNRMDVIKTDAFGQLLKKSELTNLSIISVPKAVEAVALVNDEPKQKAGKSPKRFKL
ncbi:hypothetical protein EIB75_12445 [Epilithonimonas vandammei]|jgi:hypothetical protein|uniref:Uncharacterized protein n=2 Tax=Flavobacteriales TaxID=200644 RepID=A0A2U8QT43_9FLAO|nr:MULTISPECIES: hypothetical protein [Bacteroidota]MBF01287.1 hypothetical protein [Flavobacterium sp.]HBI88359.1 hypothetical protein [Sphingobacterium sp.]AWM13332.1 hypothetical protein DI487_05290 [Flavobacterium sediminis]AZI56023.1 hypothetical protein EIB75_12445 [Epilithonimonas vandammei]MBS5795426.1 hypothetical protein [Dysgonomonas mossii]|tara:strand:- start:61201 stop:61629 length:429 start_codon:yes stop_codon:yes gene_type:complete